MKTRSELSEERMSDEKVEIVNTAFGLCCKRGHIGFVPDGELMSAEGILRMENYRMFAH